MSHPFGFAGYEPYSGFGAGRVSLLPYHSSPTPTVSLSP